MPLVGGPNFRRGRRRGLVVGAAIGKRRANNAQQPAPEQASEEPAYVAELKQLEQLKEQGVITQEEFDAKKKKLLGL